ncbi:MAG: LacI family transcriptional regulator [Lachnospiraceae bacterium]|nr:LacI family transcriptional regulator [Lachnospiraceae bacterium]
MITLQQIADEAGVSKMTVSNVINGRFDKVSNQKIELIQGIIEKNHYVPNLSARSLVKHQSRMIALLVNAFVLDYNVFKDPYISRLFGEIETAIRATGYYTIVQTVDNIKDSITLLRNWNVDGAIFLTPQKEEDMELLRRQAICPMVFLDNYYQSDSHFLSVNIDDYKGGYIATKHLLLNGHRKIAFASYFGEKSDVISTRLKGYSDALREFGISESCIIDTFTRYEDGMSIGRDIANHKYDITAVFATSDHLALGIIKGCSLNGCIVPNDLSVIGFDDLDLCTISTPELTTVAQDVHDKAEETVKLLLRAISEDEVSRAPITCDVELKVRQTVQNISSGNQQGLKS